MFNTRARCSPPALHGRYYPNEGTIPSYFLASSAGILSKQAAAPWSMAACLLSISMTSSRLYPDYDIVVCGAGCAGLAAALVSARSGARVLLVERSAFAGGIITNVGLSYFDGIADAVTDRIVLRGMAFEFLQRLGICPAGATHLDQVDPARAVYRHGAITIRNIEQFKVLADQMLMEQSGRLDVLYHTTLCGVKADSDNRITEVHLANKDGLSRVQAKIFIDATGDADLVRFSGGNAERSAVMMPMTLHFRVGNVTPHPTLKQRAKDAVVNACNAGELPFFYGPCFEFSFAPDEITVHAVRVPGDASNARDLSRAEMQARKDAWAIFECWKKHVPEFKHAYYVTSGPHIGVRETWRIIGETALTEDDINTRRTYDDAVATGTWYMDVHPNEVTVGSANDFVPRWPGPYHIRYGSLRPKTLPNVLVAGRCHSATRRAASSSRVTCTSMDMGQSAGVAATLALKHKLLPAELSGVNVREELERQGLAPWSD